MGGKWKGKKALKLSVEYDSEQDHILTRASVKLLDGLAKLRTACQVPFREAGGFQGSGLKLPPVRNAVVGLFTDLFFVDCDVDQCEVLAGFSKASSYSKISYDHEVVAQQGHLYAKGRLPWNPAYSVDVAADFSTKPLTQNLPFRRTGRSGETKSQDSDAEPSVEEEDFRVQTVADFPNGRMFFAASNRQEEGEVLGFGGMLETSFGGWGRGRVEYLHAQRKVDLKYHYKDEDFTLSPTLSLPSRQCLLVFKRRFDDRHKFSALYSVRDVAWRTEYKYAPSPHLKLKLGHHSAANTLWTALWVGKEEVGARLGPKQLKAQIMLQLNHETKQLALLFKIKKRVDFFG